MATHTGTKAPGTAEKKQNSASLVQKVGKDTRPLQQFITKFNNDWVMNFAGMLAYNLILSIFPIAVAILSIIGLLLGPGVRANIIHSIENAHILPSTVSPSIIENVLAQLNKTSGILGIIAIVTAVFFGSRLFIVVEACFDIIYHVRPRKLIRQNLMALGMLLLFVVLIPIMIFASSIPSLAASTVLQYTFLGQNQFVFTIAGIIGGLVAGFFLFEAIYIVVPNQRISWKHSWLGALTADIALEIYLLLFPLYLRYFLNGYIGQVGFAIVLLIFFYYFAVILLLGAEMNAFFSEKVQPLPNDLATFISTMAGKLNKDRPSVEGPHLDPKPTNEADARHIEEAHGHEHQTERKNTEKNTQLQQQVAARGLAKETIKEKAKEKEAVAKHPSKGITLLEVVIGSTVAAAIELWRWRRPQKPGHI